MSDLEKMLAERKKQHGDFTVHAGFSQQLKNVARDTCGYNPSLRSFPLDWSWSWDDIADYAKITRDRIK